MHYKKLYRRTASGAVQVWWLELKGDCYRTHSGQLHGEKVVSEWTRAWPTNVGKSNARNAEEQAVFEVEAEYRKKRKIGYVDTVKKAMKETFRVMLAQNYEDRIDLVAEHLEEGKTVLSQPKLNGIRCIASFGGLLSRKNTPIVSCPHIVEQLKPVFDRYPELILDGELYNHTLMDDFHNLSGCIRKTNLSSKQLKYITQIVQLHVYDMYHPDMPQLVYRQREIELRSIYKKFFQGKPSMIRFVPSKEVQSLEHIEELYKEYISHGYEGQILRLNHHYDMRRSKFLLKHKEWKDAEFKVVDIIEGKGNRAGMAGSVKLRLGKNKFFYSMPMGDRAFLKRLLKEKKRYIGGEATVRFFDYTPAGVPFHPRITTFWPEGRDL